MAHAISSCHDNGMTHSGCYENRYVKTPLNWPSNFTGESRYRANHAQRDRVLTHSLAYYTVVSVCSYIYLLVTPAIETCGTCSRDRMGGCVFVHSALPRQGPKITDAQRKERGTCEAQFIRELDSELITRICWSEPVFSQVSAWGKPSWTHIINCITYLTTYLYLLIWCLAILFNKSVFY